MHRLMRIFDERAVLTPNIWGYLWSKLAYGALLFATALTNESIADCLAEPKFRPVFIALAREVVRRRDGAKGSRSSRSTASTRAPSCRMPDPAAAASLDALVVHNRKSAKTHSGIWRDLAVRKRKTEVEAQIGPDRRNRREARPVGAADPPHRRPDPRHRGWPRPLAWDTLAELAETAAQGGGRSMKIAFDGQNVIVTGAGHGFGRAIAKAFADAGAQVWACDLNAAGLQETSELCGSPARCARSTSSDRAAVSAFVAEAADGAAIDVLVNNAGGVRGQVGRPIEEISEADWHTIFDVNVTGAFYCSQAVAPGMKQQQARPHHQHLEPRRARRSA